MNKFVDTDVSYIKFLPPMGRVKAFFDESGDAGSVCDTEAWSRFAGVILHNDVREQFPSLVELLETGSADDLTSLSVELCFLESPVAESLASIIDGRAAHDTALAVTAQEDTNKGEL